jgi:hypothetical protein
MDARRRSRAWCAALTAASLASCSPAEVEEISRSVEEAGGALSDVRAATGDWPWWRGPERDGKAAATDSGAPPIEWSESKNVLWKADLPGHGHGSACVAGERVYLATADEDAETQSLLAFDRATGKPVWSRAIHRGPLMHRHPKNSHASCTPACDGERVFTAFMAADGIWVTAVDLDGTILWQTKAGDFTSMHGYGASPLLYGATVIVPGDNTGGAFLAALHRKTGTIVWRARRPNVASFSSPVVAHVAGTDQLLLSGGGMTASYDPATGRELWRVNGPADTTACTMTADGDLVFASGGYPQKEILCIRADGAGGASDRHVAWRTHKNATYVPSPLVHAGRLYVVDDGGVATCYRATTGEVLWQRRLGGGFSASPTFAAGRIYVTSESGTTFVIAAEDAFRLLAENQLGDAGFASPVVAGGQLFLRTGDALYCIGERTL